MLLTTSAKVTSLQLQPNWIKTGILLGNDFHYRKQRPAVHNVINLSVCGLLCLGMVALGRLATWLSPVAFMPLGAVGFGVLYFALFILVVHEASHQMFVCDRNLQQARKWNRACGWLVCVPLGIDYAQHWEIGHRIHHADPCRPADPQNCPSTLYTGWPLFKFLAKTLLIPGFIQFSATGYHCPATAVYPFNGRLLAAQMGVWASFVAGCAYAGSWAVPVAAFLGLQVLAALNLLKIAMEHGGAVSEQANPYLRSTSSFFWARSLLMPFNISLHFEHHLNACVPWYHLMKYHRALKQIVPEAMQADLFNAHAEVWARIQSPMPTALNSLSD